MPMTTGSTMDKLKMHSPDLTQDNIARIRELFPGCVTEAADKNGKLLLAVDFDQLRQELSSHVVDGPQERYHLNWPGKREALLAANAPIAKSLRPCRDESVNFDETQNLFIEGDNLEALKLLQETYLGRVKLIYIDPPYNTGRDFVYEDDFATSAPGYFSKSSQVDEERNRLVLNSEANGRFHSDWLSMVFPRLKLAQNLLCDDGVIFISIDDNEVSRMRDICDEVFGGENFVACIVWQKTLTRRNDARLFSSAHEYVLGYARDITRVKIERIEADEKQRATYANRDNDPRGDWLPIPFHAPNIRPNLTYPITTPGGRVLMPPAGRCWSTTQQKFKELVADNRIYFGKDGNGMAQRKKFWAEREDGMVPWTWWPFDYAGENREATKELKDLFDDENPFDAPKPTKLIRRLLSLIAAKDDDIFLDFFAGSGTFAHALLAANAEDGVGRRFVAVQIAEIFRNDESGTILVVLRQPHAEVVVPHIGGEVVADDPVVARTGGPVDDDQIEDLQEREALVVPGCRELEVDRDDVDLQGVAVTLGVVPAGQVVEPPVDHRQSGTEVLLPIRTPRQAVPASGGVEPPKGPMAL